MINRIIECNKELEKLARKTRLSKLAPRASSRHLQSKTHQLPSPEIRDYANLSHELLGRYWRCECSTTHTEAKLQLAMHRNLEKEIRFEILFRTSSTGSSKWQQGEIRVALSEA